jgi:hypothetical protein
MSMLMNLFLRWRGRTNEDLFDVQINGGVLDACEHAGAEEEERYHSVEPPNSGDGGD